jgi:membrane associated rhomboid family serine protease
MLRYTGTKGGFRPSLFLCARLLLACRDPWGTLSQREPIADAPPARQEHLVKSREPIFNVPAIVIATIALLAIIHAVRTLVLTPSEELEVLLRFAFIPARFGTALAAHGEFPGGFAADVWTFVTYALLHSDWTHVGVNAVWLLPFGSAVARRFGTLRFVALFIVTAAAGAAFHLATHRAQIMMVNSNDLVIMIGASGAVSGFMAAAIRFAFQHGGPLENWRNPGPESYRIPAAPLSVALRNPRVFLFLAIWLVLNFLFGIGGSFVPGAPADIAWQTHLGGFLAGLLLFPLFDPVRAAQHARNDNPSDGMSDSQ